MKSWSKKHQKRPNWQTRWGRINCSPQHWLLEALCKKGSLGGEADEIVRTEQTEGGLGLVALCLSLLYGPTFTSVHNYWKNHGFDCTDLCL